MTITYAFTEEELDQLSTRIGLAMGRRHLALLDALRHHPVFVKASLDEQHDMEAAISKAVESVAAPNIREMIR